MWAKTEQLSMPQVVKDACGLYHTAMDDVKQFINEYCVIGPDNRVLVKELFGKYRYRMEQNSKDPLGKQKFNTRVRSLGFVDKLLPGSTWVGMRLKNSDEPGEY